MPTSVRDWPLTSDGVRDKFVAVRRDGTGSAGPDGSVIARVTEGDSIGLWPRIYNITRTDCVYWPGLIVASRPKTPDQWPSSCCVMGNAADEAITRPTDAYRFYRCGCTLVTWTAWVVPRQHPINSWLLWHGYIHIQYPLEGIHKRSDVAAVPFSRLLEYIYSYCKIP